MSGIKTKSGGIGPRVAKAWRKGVCACQEKRRDVKRGKKRGERIEEHALGTTERSTSVGMPVAHPLVHLVPRWLVNNVFNVSRVPWEVNYGCWLAPCCCQQSREVHGPTTPPYPVSENWKYILNSLFRFFFLSLFLFFFLLSVERNRFLIIENWFFWSIISLQCVDDRQVSSS